MAGDMVFEGQAVYANSAPQNTVVNIDVPSSEELSEEHDEFLIAIRNPSAVTDLSVAVKSKETATTSFGAGTTRYPTLTTLAVPKNNPDGLEFRVQGWPLGATPGRLAFTNATVLGGADGFTAEVRIRRV